MIYLDAGATTLQKPPAVAFAVQSAMRRMATPGRGGHPPAGLCRRLAAERKEIGKHDTLLPLYRMRDPRDSSSFGRIINYNYNYSRNTHKYS